jgi:hypothetical protein
VSVPNEGWEEISIDRLREFNVAAAQRLQHATSARQKIAAESIRWGSSAAIQRAESGSRVFTVELDDERVFAATKAHTKPAP